MILVRVFAAAVKPALAGGIVAAAVGGGALAWSRWGGDDVTAFQRIQGGGQHLLISEFGETSDTIVAVDPADTSSRETIVRIDHADGYGIFATVSPDGRAIAYTALPPGTKRPSPDTPAQAAIVGVRGDTTLLADDIDLLIPPVWAPDSGAIVVRKNTPAENAAGTFELLLLGRDGARTSITTWHSASLFPIAFAPDGATLYFATLNADGTDLYAIAPDGSGERLVAHLSDEIARDWRLSPDGATLAYTVAAPGGVAAMTVDVVSGVASAASGDDGRVEVNPAWREDGTLTIASVDADGRASRAVSISDGRAPATVAERADGVDLPMTWAPDGSALVVRSVDGVADGRADSASLEIIRGDGVRERVSGSADALIVGWVE